MFTFGNKYINMHEATYFIKSLKLEPHPEGGYFKETYRSDEKVVRQDGSPANAATSIYYLLEENQRSAFHRVNCDEQWFFHTGETLEICYIQNGQWQSVLLGSGLGESLQAMVPANTWFTAGIVDKLGFSLVSCVVAPGFEFSGFELAEEDALIEAFPHLASAIRMIYR